MVHELARKQCTKENPYTPQRDKDEPGDGWEHDAVYEKGEQEDGYPSGDTVRMCCKNCNIEWTKELAQ